MYMYQAERFTKRATMENGTTIEIEVVIPNTFLSILSQLQKAN